MSFINRGIPGYGIIGAYDSSTNQAVGGNENPYPANYASKPTLGQYASYDTNDDTIQHLNYYASGTTHGPGGVDRRPRGSSGRSSCRRRGRTYVIAGTRTAARSRRRTKPMAYFETEPAKPTTDPR